MFYIPKNVEEIEFIPPKKYKYCTYTWMLGKLWKLKAAKNAWILN